ncbi:MAG: hypothetical protein Pars2KO_14490 [Parasphingorhabdus sp.]
MHLAKTESGSIVTRFGKAALAAALLAGIGGTALAQNMVVRSTGPSASSYPAGKKLNNNSRITLQKLDRITILEKAGTRVLKGPGSFTIGKRGGTQSTASRRVAGFISNRGASRARTGAVRGSGTAAVVVEPKNPNLWYLDVTKSGKFCVSNPNRLVLWRPDYTGSATASILEPISGVVTNVEWRKGGPLKAWPRAQAPVTNGSSYRVLSSSNQQAVEINFVLLPEVPASLDETASLLIEKGCESQLDLLVDTLNTDTEQG